MSQLSDAHTKLKQIRDKKDLKLRPTPHLKTTFTDFSGNEKPLVVRYYQVQGILHLVVMKRFLLGDDTGLGKTLETIAALCYVWESDKNRKVIVLTTKSALRQWVREFPRFTNGVKVFACSGDREERAAAREAYVKATGPAVLVMGYRSACNDLTGMQDWKDYILVLDEATVFKNPKTQVHQVVRYFSGVADRVWALTATLIKNHLMEGFGIYEVVVPGLFRMSANKFMTYFCTVQLTPIKGGRKIPVIIGYPTEKVKEFREFIDPYFLGRPKHEVATDLPTLTFREIEVRLTPEQESLYNDAISGMIEVKDKTAGAAPGAMIEKEVSKLTAIGYCQQIVNHPDLIGREGESPKLEALIDLLTDGDLADEKVIVFSRFKKMIDLVMPRLKAEKIKAVRITGDEDDKQRDAAQTSFLNPDSDVRVACITTAGSDAINLQAAKAIICFDTPWSGGEFIQLAGRMIRIGSVHDRCFIIHLVGRGAKKTVDHRILEVLGKKMGLIEMVLGKRLKGDGDTSVITVDNDISDIYSGLRADARELTGRKS
jgi:SNF2 family DNA or RNA helicase